MLAAALCTATVMGASSALAADINFVTAGTSSTFYPISATVCQLWNDNIDTAEKIQSEYNGKNIKQLAMKYGYTERWLRKVIKDAEEK